MSMKEERCKRLMSELQNGIIKKDVLLNSSYSFTGEAAADYSSQMQIFMRSSMGKLIMHSHKDCPEIDLMKLLEE